MRTPTVSPRWPHKGRCHVPRSGRRCARCPSLGCSRTTPLCRGRRCRPGSRGSWVQLTVSTDSHPVGDILHPEVSHMFQLVELLLERCKAGPKPLTLSACHLAGCHNLVVESACNAHLPAAYCSCRTVRLIGLFMPALRQPSGQVLFWLLCGFATSTNPAGYGSTLPAVTIGPLLTSLQPAGNLHSPRRRRCHQTRRQTVRLPALRSGGSGHTMRPRHDQ